MLQGIKAEISLTGGVRMAVDGNDAAFFAELGVGITKCRSFDSLRSLRMTDFFGDAERLRNIRDIFDSLVKQPAHAGTSPWRVASRAAAQGFFRLARDAAIMGWR
jgi:hypothetical protein